MNSDEQYNAIGLGGQPLVQGRCAPHLEDIPWPRASLAFEIKHNGKYSLSNGANLPENDSSFGLLLTSHEVARADHIL